MQNACDSDSCCGLACDASSRDAKSLAMRVERCEPLRLGTLCTRPSSRQRAGNTCENAPDAQRHILSKPCTFCTFPSATSCPPNVMRSQGHLTTQGPGSLFLIVLLPLLLPLPTSAPPLPQPLTECLRLSGISGVLMPAGSMA